MKQLLSNFTWILLDVVCLFSLTAFLGQYSGFLDLTSQFRWLYTGILTIAVIWMLLCRHLRVAVLLLCFLGVNVSQVLPFYNASSVASLGTISQRLRLITFNTWAKNESPQKIADLIMQERPDIVAMQEITDSNYRFLESHPTAQVYPYRVRCEAGRLALWSRFPVSASSTRVRGPVIIEARLTIQGKNLAVLVAHTDRPLGNYPWYAKQLALIGERAKHVGEPVIVMGDLNTGPWSFPFRSLLQKTGLKNSQIGFGVPPTYPVIIPKTRIAWPMPILPLDHVLVSPQIQVTNRFNGPYSGSDHLPVVVDVLLPTFE